MREPGPLRLIIAYKAVKGALMMLVGLGLSIAIWVGHAGGPYEFASWLREHVTAALAVETADTLMRFATPYRLSLTSLALALDGSVGITEAWLLHRGRTWAFWLVVVASSVLIPWEIYELVAHFRPLRLVMLVLNVAVVLYLARQARRHSSTSSGSAAGGGTP